MRNNHIRERVLQMLMEDSRKSFRTIAAELDISTTTVSRVVKELEDAGVILGYTTMVDWRKMGRDQTLCLQIEVDPKVDIEKVGQALKGEAAVKQVFYTTGDTDFSAYAVCRDTSEASEVLDRLRHINGILRVIPHTVLKVF